MASRAASIARPGAVKNGGSESRKPLSAASDYLDLYYRFPLNDEAKAAGQKIPSLQAALGDHFPGTRCKRRSRVRKLFTWQNAGMMRALSSRDSSQNFRRRS